ncbi:MAG: IPTL-CTERM sorting domain-containing protein [Burkholderiales bacterium]|nr:IPTL-CTERM sorting domain-containing protein [Burkholderiales bacterium]
MALPRLVLAVLLTVVAAAAHAQSAVFTLKDKTNLASGTYKIYVTGFSTAGPYVLQQDGSWAAPTANTGTLPCYEFTSDTTVQNRITQVQINAAQAGISARVYYFVVTDLAAFPSCNPTGGASGLFNNSNAFTYSSGGASVNEPPVGDVTSKAFPAWTYSEIGASASYGTIDLSQVDFFAFPMYTTATASSGPSSVGNPVGAGNPADVVNHVSMRDSYATYINALAEAANNHKSCHEDDTPAVCAYLDLLQNVKTPGSQVAQYVIQNPGGYLGQNTSVSQASRLNTAFDGVIDALWHSASPPTLTIDTGGALGGAAANPGAVPPTPAYPTIPEDVFTSSIVTITYPGTTYPMKAMKFTGTATSGNYVAYVFSPKDYQNGCASQQITNCTSPASTGWQVFADGGMLTTPPDAIPYATYTALSGASLLSSNAGTYGGVGYNAVVSRLGFLIAAAMTRGVARVSCGRTYTWQCWQDETYWYPTATSATYPDITQSVFSRWMHTATIGGTPMFLQPPGAVNSASSSPGGGKLMGMAYGLANDENPTPTVPSPPAATAPQPEVPSKLDGTVVFGGAGPYEIVFGPWMTQGVLNPMLTVILEGKGSVSSSPAGIACDPACSHAYPPNTQVILTAKPHKGWVFLGWTGGGCTSGRSTTCTLTLTQNTTVTAQFGAILAAPPTQEGLHVVVNGAGTVTSAPAGIDCGAECSKAFGIGTQVTLSAVPAAGAAFAGWSGACTGSGATCVVDMTDAKSVGAAFVAATHFTLAVASGAGGTVTSIPGGIDCGTRCIAGFAPGAIVGLTAQPRPGYRFAGWSGACSGTQTCDLAMDGNKAVQASFAAIAPGQYSLTVHDFGPGSITSSPPGINCGTSCSAAFARDTKVSLFASAAPGYQFAGWSGACTGFGACAVYMDDVANVSAVFVPGAVPPGPLPGEPIPTLSEWALMLLCLMVLALAYRQLRTRQARAGRGGRGERI